MGHLATVTDLEHYELHMHELAEAEAKACAAKLEKYGFGEDNVFAIVESGAERAGISVEQCLHTWMDRAARVSPGMGQEARLKLLKALFGYCCLMLAWEART